MSHNSCSQGSCGGDHHSHGHHHKSCSCTENCCPCCKCGCHNHEDQHHHHRKGSFARKLLELADEAWYEVLQDKMEDQIEATSGEKLDELAKLVTEANKARWQSKLSANSSCHDYEDKINQFFKKE